MKIAILHSGDLDGISPGGMDTYVKNFITGLPKSCSVTVFGVCPHDASYELGVAVQRSINGHNYSFIPIIDDSKYPLSTRFTASLLKIRKKFDEFDVVYAQRVDFSLAFVFSKQAKKLIQVVHGTSYAYRLMNNPLTRFLRYFSEWLSVRIARKTLIVLKRNDTGLPYYQAKYPSQAKKFQYIHLPLDIASFRDYAKLVNRDTERDNLGLSQNDYVVTYAGRVNHEESKRTLLYPDIAARLPENYKFIIVGDGPSLKDLVNKCDEYGVLHRFLFTGMISDTRELVKYYSISDMTINISFTEGTCTSVLESAALGVPVVSTDTGDIHEIIHRGHNGIIIHTQPEDRMIDEAVDGIQSIAHNGITIDDSVEAYELYNAVSKQISLMESMIKQ